MPIAAADLLLGDAPRAFRLRLPINGEVARALLRGDAAAALPSAELIEPGNPVDLVGLGWSFLYAVSPDLASFLSAYSGAALRPLLIGGQPSKYQLLGVDGRCGRVEYERSQVVGATGSFVRLRGLATSREPDADLSVPTNRDSIVVSRNLRQALADEQFKNVMLLDLETMEYDIPRRLLD